MHRVYSSNAFFCDCFFMCFSALCSIPVTFGLVPSMKTLCLLPQALAAWNLNFVIEELMMSLIKQLISSYSNRVIFISEELSFSD